MIQRKVNIILERLAQLGKIVPKDQQNYLSADFTVQKATEKILQELVEAACDINTHILVEEGKNPPEEYRKSFLLLGEYGLLPLALMEALAPAGGLRNVLVHLYENLDNAKVHEAARKAQDLFPRYIQAVTQYLQKRKPTS